MPIIEDTNQYSNNFSSSRDKRENMLFEIGNNIIDTNLSNNLKNTYSNNIFDSRWIISNEFKEWKEALINNRNSKYNDEGKEVSCSK